jgi:hypothetical protein
MKLLLVSLPVFVPQIALAQISNPITFTNLNDFLEALIDLLILIATPIIVVFVIYSGFLFVTAGGNTEKLNRAKKTLLWTLIGALILLGAEAVRILVEGTITDITTP